MTGHVCEVATVQVCTCASAWLCKWVRERWELLVAAFTKQQQQKKKKREQPREITTPWEQRVKREPREIRTNRKKNHILEGNNLNFSNWFSLWLVVWFKLYWVLLLSNWIWKIKNIGRIKLIYEECEFLHGVYYYYILIYVCICVSGNWKLETKTRTEASLKLPAVLMAAQD